MRRFSTGRRHTRPVAVEVPVGPPPGGDPDDLTTWANSAFVETMVLPGTVSDKYDMIVDVTKIINPAAVADIGSLRFVRSDGVKLGHYRSSVNRIFIVGRFIGGIKNKIHYYWGKSGATQPGTGFPTHAEMMAPYRLSLIFEGGVALDFSNDPAQFTVVGSPTIHDGKLGKAMKFSEGSYIETMAEKLRGGARDKRSIFALIHIPDTTARGRAICWANWNTGQRALQLWVSNEGVLEFYHSGNGETFTPWRVEGVNRTGWNAIGASWEAGNPIARILLNNIAEESEPSFSYTTPPGPLFNSNEPYIVGGTKIPGAYFNGSTESQFELFGAVSVPQFLAWKDAWDNNDVFWGIADRTPDSIDVPSVDNAPLSSEVAFARKEITGISPGTSVSVAGDGNPTYSLGSSFDVIADIKAKGNTDGTAKAGDWLATYHESASSNSTVTESTVTVGTVTSTRKSTTVSVTDPTPTEDRTPDAFDVPELLDKALNSEVAFNVVQVNGMDNNTPISVSGAGNPTYSISSSSAATGDIKAKGSSSGTINPGQYVKVWHTASGTHNTVVESTLTIGTVGSKRISRTLMLVDPGTGGGGSTGIPPGEATVKVTSLAALKTAINNAKSGDIIEIAQGDYKSQGSLAFSNKDFRSFSKPLVIRASRRAFRGYLPSQGGLWVSGETSFRSGSGGAEFNGGLFKNIHNIVFDGIRLYAGPASVTKYYAADFGGCTNLTFQHFLFSGPYPQVQDSNGNWILITDESKWRPYKGEKPYPNGWGIQGRGINLGRSLDRCDNIKFKHGMFQFFGMQMDFAGTSGCSIEDCVLVNSGSDHMRTDGGQDNLIIRRNIFYRQFPQQGTGPDVAHPDAVQNTTKTQPGWRNHILEGNIVSVGDSGHGKMQGFFYECDNYPEYPQGYGNYYKNNIMISPTVNTLTLYPADRNTIEYCTIIKDYCAVQQPDRTANILFGKSFHNNKAYRVVYDSLTQDGDNVNDCIQLSTDNYEQELYNYGDMPTYYGKENIGFVWKPRLPLVRILNPYTGVLRPDHLKMIAPKASSYLHPNQQGHHMGASERFQELGALP